MRLTDCPMRSFWYQRFMRGYHERVGDLIKQDLGISLAVMVALMAKLTLLHEGKQNDVRTIEIVLYCKILHLGDLRGNEGFLVNLGECWKLWEAALRNIKHPRAVIPLHGN